MIATALTIAGSDSGGGAGIQADLLTFAALGVHGTSAITAITAQNTRGVQAVLAMPPDLVARQIAAVLDDFDVRAIKIGMVFSAAIVTAIADALVAYPSIPVVVDPVMIATSGDRLIDETASATLIERLFTRAICVTPNLTEAAALTGRELASNEDQMTAQGREILARGAKSVLMKGGHGGGCDSVDLLVTGDRVTRFSAPRIETGNTHGTGCTLSAAIAAGLAGGRTLEDAVGVAKRYLQGAIAAGRDRSVGHGAGPVHHLYDLKRVGS